MPSPPGNIPPNGFDFFRGTRPATAEDIEMLMKEAQNISAPAWTRGLLDRLSPEESEVGLDDDEELFDPQVELEDEDEGIFAPQDGLDQEEAAVDNITDNMAPISEREDSSTPQAGPSRQLRKRPMPWSLPRAKRTRQARQHYKRRRQSSSGGKVSSVSSRYSLTQSTMSEDDDTYLPKRSKTSQMPSTKVPVQIQHSPIVNPSLPPEIIVISSDDTEVVELGSCAVKGSSQVQDGEPTMAGNSESDSSEGAPDNESVNRVPVNEDSVNGDPVNEGPMHHEIFVFDARDISTPESSPSDATAGSPELGESNNSRRYGFVGDDDDDDDGDVDEDEKNMIAEAAIRALKMAVGDMEIEFELETMLLFLQNCTGSDDLCEMLEAATWIDIDREVFKTQWWMAVSGDTIEVAR